MSKYADQVKEFMDKFEPNPAIAGKLIREEFMEWFTETEEGTAETELKELCDLLYVVYFYANTQDKWDIEKNGEEIAQIIKSANEYKDKYPDINLPVVIISTAFIEFITSKNYMWLYRLGQGIFAYAKLKGWPLEQAFKRVHNSNMSKATKEGKVLRREDGKVLKSDQYKPANLKDLLATKPKAKVKKTA